MIKGRQLMGFVAAVASLLTMTSCNKEKTPSYEDENRSNSVIFQIDIPAEYQLSRTSFPTIPDGHQLRCIIEIWNDDLSDCIERKELTTSGNNDDVKVEIEVEDATYNYLIWADYIANSATATEGHYDDLYYTTNDSAKGLKMISITDERGDNAANREAFYQKATQFTMASKEVNINATLTRAITMLTIAETNVENVTKCDEINAQYDVPSTFDVSDGSADGSTEVNYQGSPAGQDLTIEGVNYKSLFVDYILTDNDGGTMGDIEMSFTSADNSVTFANTTIPAGIPVKQNYQTYATGELLRIIDSGNVDSDDDSNKLNVTVSFACDWSGTINHPIINKGDGTKDNPYPISSAQDLITLSSKVSPYTNEDILAGAMPNPQKGVYYILTKDVDLAGEYFIPIGSRSSDYFAGNFDGNGHKITGLNINTEIQYCGLFGCISDGAVISDLTVVGTLTNNKTSNIYTGGIVGRMNGDATIIDCVSDVTIITQGDGYIGGVTSYNDGGSIIGSSFTGSITSTNQSSRDNNIYYGGIAGFCINETSIINSYNRGNIKVTYDGTANSTINTGGLVGYNSGSCVNSYNYGSVSTSGIDSTTINCGGIIGSNSSITPIYNCYSAGEATTSSDATNVNVGGVIGYNTSATNISKVYSLSGSSTDDTQEQSINGAVAAPTAAFATQLNANAHAYNSKTPKTDSNKWIQSEGVNGGFPTLTSTSAGIGE